MIAHFPKGRSDSLVATRVAALVPLTGLRSTICNTYSTTWMATFQEIAFFQIIRGLDMGEQVLVTIAVGLTAQEYDSVHYNSSITKSTLLFASAATLRVLAGNNRACHTVVIDVAPLTSKGRHSERGCKL